LVNVHAAGGSEMMKRAVEGIRKYNSNIKIIAVTQLTSTTETMLRDEQNIQSTMDEAVLNYARLAQLSGLDGVVCSPLEANLVKQELGESFLKVTPGIRPENTSSDDQQRITTPEKASVLGATNSVVGRPITQSENPVRSEERREGKEEKARMMK